MATYVLFHGASSESWYWHRVIPELQRLGHEVMAPDLPCDDDAARLAEYADTVIDAIGGRLPVARSGSPRTDAIGRSKRERQAISRSSAFVPGDDRSHSRLASSIDPRVERVARPHGSS